MKLLLWLALGSLAFLVTNGKKIKIEIESDDLVNIIESMMYSEVLQKFTSQLIKKRSDNHTLDNPYHPEDELLNSFSIDVDKKIEHVSLTPKLNVSTDALETLNDQFLDKNNFASNDLLTDAEDMKSINKVVEKLKLNKFTSNSTSNSTDEHIETQMKKNIDNAVKTNSMSSRKDGIRIFGDDRFYLKPVQRRFVLKGSNDTPTL